MKTVGLVKREMLNCAINTYEERLRCMPGFCEDSMVVVQGSEYLFNSNLFLNEKMIVERLEALYEDESHVYAKLWRFASWFDTNKIPYPDVSAIERLWDERERIIFNCIEDDAYRDIHNILYGEDDIVKFNVHGCVQGEYADVYIKQETLDGIWNDDIAMNIVEDFLFCTLEPFTTYGDDLDVYYIPSTIWYRNNYSINDYIRDNYADILGSTKYRWVKDSYKIDELVGADAITRAFDNYMSAFDYNEEYDEITWADVRRDILEWDFDFTGEVV